MSMDDVYFLKKFVHDEDGTKRWYIRVLKQFDNEDAAEKEAKFLWKLGAAVRVEEVKPNKWCVYYKG